MDGMIKKTIDSFKVEITENFVPRAWYNGMKGRKFEVVKWGGHYVLKKDFELGYNALWHHINKSDCKIIKK